MSTHSDAGVIPHWTRGDRMRKARALAGMTTREFAAEIGVSQKTITDAEGDKRATVRRPILIAYAMASGVSLAWLETGVEPSDGPDDGGVSVTSRYAVPHSSHLRYLAAA